MLKEINLTNFRNYASYLAKFDRITCFIGRNGVGKTNILEAICYLALGRSFRTRLDIQAIRFETEAARVVGQTDSSQLEVAIGRQGKKLIKIDGVSRRSLDLLGRLAVVVFLPESLQLVAGPPQLRRQFLDLLLIQEDRRYAYHLLQLQKVLRQRNKLLKLINEAGTGADQLAFWDETLIEHSGLLFLSRARVLAAINETLAERYRTMSGQKGELGLEYRPAAVSASEGESERLKDPAGQPTDQAAWAALLGRTLAKYQYRELAAGRTLYGPQRDDFVFILDGRPLADFGSRGELRSAVLALKACEADYLINHFKNQTGSADVAPLVFLLDDVYSELDEERRGQLARLIGDHQAVITTTDLSHLDTNLQKIAKVVTLASRPEGEG